MVYYLTAMLLLVMQGVVFLCFYSGICEYK